MSHKYINEIKGLIKGEALKIGRMKSVTHEDIEGTYDVICKKIQTMEQLIWEVPPVDEDTLKTFFDTARKEYLTINPVKIAPSSSLTRKGLGKWLTDDRHAAINWNYLDRYLRYLEKNGRSEAVVKETKRSSRDIISRLGDPESGASFFIKGLVVGEVQSGKTANFNAVINRSIDAGYQLIIVFSGIMEDLRGQTQDRVESEVVGFGKNSDHNGIKGVGEEIHFGGLGTEGVRVIDAITSCDSDFNQGLLKGAAALNSPKILVCKKNVSVLRNIINWLGDLQPNEGEQLSIPLLVLDDEADNASLNNEGAKGREYASKVNGHMRAILAMFEQKSYLGYTASPFANVLQDRNDTAQTLWPVKSTNGDRTFEQVDNLFPDDFIFRLKSPTNYIGAKEIFETIAEVPKLPVVSVVSDHMHEFPSRLRKSDDTPVMDFPTQQDWDERVGEFGNYLDFTTRAEFQRGTRASKRDDGFPENLPKSLRDAVLCFLLSVAVRESRIPSQSGSGLFEPHNTMLVHVSRFTTWQNKTAELIESYLEIVTFKVQNDNPDEVGSIYLEFEDVWNRYFSDIISNVRSYLSEDYDDLFMVPVAFDVVRNFLRRAVDDLDVLAINSKTGQKLVYSTNQPRKIIAVGGNRLSRGFTVRGLTINYFVRSTNYSDTLLQMGRWFGYRPGYLDCCRIFTTRHSVEKFNATTRCIEELENEFEKMHDLEKSPSNFILKVRKDPGVLQITRPSILKNATTVKWSFEDKLEMTTRFNVSRKKISSVWENFRSYTAPLLNASKNSDQNFAKMELKGPEIIEFLERPNNFDPVNLEAMIRFIKLCQKSNKLTNWTVALKLAGRSKRRLRPEETNLNIDTGLVIRRGPRGASPRQIDLRSQFCDENVFRASGKSANIVSSSRDLSLPLGATEILDAELDFRNKKEEALLRSGMSAGAAKQEASKTTIPERVYRECIPEAQAVLLIYLFDTHYCFNQDDDKADPDQKFSNFIKDGEHDLNVPLVGYAIGFPPISDKKFVGTYMQGDYDLSIDEDFDEDESVEDISVPRDESM
jgi:hypothetical protein